jgi:hypothetical protein
MWHFKGWGIVSGGEDDNHRNLSPSRTLLLLLCTLLLVSFLAACGAVSTGPQAAHTAKAPSTPTLAPTPAVAPTATPVPTVGTPPPTVPPTPALSASAILDVRPSSMSIVGHLDCSQSGTSYTCMAEVLALSSNQGSLGWLASTTVPGNVVFHPASGVLAPGQHILISITVPLGDCTQGLFVFRGPANTHTISWAC